jgi:hemoglobin
MCDRKYFQKIYTKIGGATVVDKIVDAFYDKLLTDYRVARYFNDHDEDKQKLALKNFLTACSGSNDTDDDLKSLLNEYFLAAFAREKRESAVNESDFGFFGMIIEQDHPSTKRLCDAHSHLLKFMPDNSQYDAVVEHLASTLDELNIENNLATEVLALGESARNGVLGI